MSDIDPCQYDHTPDHKPTQHGETGYCKVCLVYDFVAYISGVNPYGPGGFHVLGLRWTPCVSALEVEARQRRHGQLPVAPSETPPVEVTPTIWFHAERQYSIDGKTPMKVSEELDNVLQVFLESQLAMDSTDIENNSGVNNASRAMSNLVAFSNGIFKSAVRIPTGKSQGGYYVRVQRL
jgi:hypothetical protein